MYSFVVDSAQNTNLLTNKLLYGCEVWCSMMTNLASKLRLHFYKTILKLGESTPTGMVYGKLYGLWWIVRCMVNCMVYGELYGVWWIVWFMVNCMVYGELYGVWWIVWCMVNCMVYGELGQFPLELQTKTRMLNFWFKLVNINCKHNFQTLCTNFFMICVRREYINHHFV